MRVYKIKGGELDGHQFDNKKEAKEWCKQEYIKDTIIATVDVEKSNCKCCGHEIITEKELSTRTAELFK